MVDSADAQALAKEGRFRLRVLRATAACFGRGLLAQFRTAPHSFIPKHFSSTRAGGVSRVHDVHSSKMSWWKMVRASAPPWERTPSCRNAVVRAAISPSLSAKSRRGTHSRTTFFLWMGRTFFGVYLLLVVRYARLGDVCGECLCFCERSDPLVVIEHFLLLGLLLSSKNISCVLSGKRVCVAQRARFFVTPSIEHSGLRGENRLLQHCSGQRAHADV